VQSLRRRNAFNRRRSWREGFVEWREAADRSSRPPEQSEPAPGHRYTKKKAPPEGRRKVVTRRGSLGSWSLNDRACEEKLDAGCCSSEGGIPRTIKAFASIKAFPSGENTGRQGHEHIRTRPLVKFFPSVLNIILFRSSIYISLMPRCRLHARAALTARAACRSTKRVPNGDQWPPPTREGGGRQLPAPEHDRE
jgi:hypothetical protein